MGLKKAFLRLATIGLGIGLMTSAALAANLRVLAWDGYADPDWVKDFTAATGIGVDVVFIGSDDEIWAKIKGSEGQDFDVFAVNTAQLQRYIKADLVSPIDITKLPNQKDVLPRFRDLSQVSGDTKDGKVYGIPFCFDSIGLIYDTDKVKPAPTSMSVLWDPAYKGKILAYDNGEHNFSFTALTLGYKDPFNLNAEQMAAVKAKLVELKRNVLSFYTTADEAQQIYQNNDVALIWANYGQQQVKALQKIGAHVAYVNPSEGALAWLDNWVISKGVRDNAAAEKWIDFMLTKKIGGELSERTGFGNTVVESSSAGGNDKLVWLNNVEDPLKRSDMWNEVKATP
ncbi:spermidine/putrescine ABC transporter substrate-binding protein [Mesorhizobium sp. SARCC-RB16n]|uniref:ABC transporter substrate-binding protein n=1 Tax=Mesorhizobium sp. SARCC-RB16n TaxID=2116687 RepID=UPI00122F29AC|nr:ABC transporter substrate-binding protein [Mesorhizobium sp. SARCC-RB16n]KAA3448701.1 spermidine/putrescine ABC transporter substrate-binding protein [Mesorhizobium sp. SARCC-RB16n]